MKLSVDVGDSGLEIKIRLGIEEARLKSRLEIDVHKYFHLVDKMEVAAAYFVGRKERM